MQTASTTVKKNSELIMNKSIEENYYANTKNKSKQNKTKLKFGKIAISLFTKLSILNFLTYLYVTLLAKN